MNSSPTRTPCIGICSTTSVGDAICRGCKRYAFEVIRWNGYSDVEKEAVLRRIESLTVQIMHDKFLITSAALLEAQVVRCKLPLNTALSPYCWWHNVLKKLPLDALVPAEFGVSVSRAYSHLSLQELANLIDEELLLLCEAHFSRYFRMVDGLG